MGLKTFWKRVKTIIKERNTTEKQTAETLNIPLGTWRGWVTKSIIPSASHCIKIAKHLNVSLDYLLIGKEQNSQSKISEIRDLLEKVNSKLSALK